MYELVTLSGITEDRSLMPSQVRCWCQSATIFKIIFSFQGFEVSLMWIKKGGDKTQISNSYSKKAEENCLG